MVRKHLPHTGEPIASEQADRRRANRLSTLSSIRGAHRVRELLLRSRVLSPCSLRVHWFVGVPNFGDQLSASVVEWATGVPVTWVLPRYERKILAVGSLLQHALAPGDVVWGSGLIRDEKIDPPQGATFLAVRGPLTRGNIGADIPQVFGDPALLLPKFHTRPVSRSHPVGIVPHGVDYAAVTIDDPAVTVIDVTRPWRDVVDAIRSCELIVSSSLHGLVVAEAYGIPAVWVRISDLVIGGSFKFHDYLLATGRDPVPPVEWSSGLSQVLRSPLPPMTFEAVPLMEAAKQLRKTLPVSCHDKNHKT